MKSPIIILSIILSSLLFACDGSNGRNGADGMDGADGIPAEIPFQVQIDHNFCLVSDNSDAQIQWPRKISPDGTYYTDAETLIWNCVSLNRKEYSFNNVKVQVKAHSKNSNILMENGNLCFNPGEPTILKGECDGNITPIPDELIISGIMESWFDIQDGTLFLNTKITNTGTLDLSYNIKGTINGELYFGMGSSVRVGESTVMGNGTSRYTPLDTFTVDIQLHSTWTGELLDSESITHYAE